MELTDLGRIHALCNESDFNLDFSRKEIEKLLPAGELCFDAELRTSGVEVFIHMADMVMDLKRYTGDNVMSLKLPRTWDSYDCDPVRRRITVAAGLQGKRRNILFQFPEYDVEEFFKAVCCFHYLLSGRKPLPASAELPDTDVEMVKALVRSGDRTRLPLCRWEGREVRATVDYDRREFYLAEDGIGTRLLTSPLPRNREAYSTCPDLNTVSLLGKNDLGIREHSLTFGNGEDFAYAAAAFAVFVESVGESSAFGDEWEDSLREISFPKEPEAPRGKRNRNPLPYPSQLDPVDVGAAECWFMDDLVELMGAVYQDRTGYLLLDCWYQRLRVRDEDTEQILLDIPLPLDRENYICLKKDRTITVLTEEGSFPIGFEVDSDYRTALGVLAVYIGMEEDANAFGLEDIPAAPHAPRAVRPQTAPEEKPKKGLFSKLFGKK